MTQPAFDRIPVIISFAEKLGMEVEASFHRNGRDVIQVDPPQAYGIVQYSRTLDMLARYGWRRASMFPHGGNQPAPAQIGNLAGCWRSIQKNVENSHFDDAGNQRDGIRSNAVTTIVSAKDRKDRLVSQPGSYNAASFAADSIPANDSATQPRRTGSIAAPSLAAQTSAATSQIASNEMSW